MSTRAIPDRATLLRHGRRLEYLTIAWNAIEGAVAVGAGAVAGSLSLLAFGGDSLIELASAAALLWRMAVDENAEHRERNEKRALRIVGVCFLLLAAYIVYEALTSLLRKQAAEHSLPGIILALLALIIMPLLARAKRKVGGTLNSAAMSADTKQSEFCAYLSAILLAGLVLNAAFGLWWADPVAALVMVPFITREGIEGIRGTSCATCSNDLPPV